jgi:nitrite transporter NirC
VVQDTVEAVAKAAGAKSAFLERSIARYVVLSMLAGAYVGLGIVLIFAIGAPLAAAGSPFVKAVMGASFGIALTLIVFAGAELFTGNAFILTVGALDGKSRLGQLAGVWGWSYLGNLVGSLALAWLVAQSGALGGEPQREFVEGVAAAKMGLDFWPALARGILCNWLVCLALWCSMRTANEGVRLVVIFWCLFGFIGAGFEHSVANMTLLALALFQPHGEAVTWLGYAQNLVPVTLGNVIGGGFFVGGLYWFAARGLSLASRPAVNAATVAGTGPTVAVEASPAAVR